MLIFIIYHLSFEYHEIYYTNTGSNQMTGNYWPHKRTLYDNKSSHIYVSNDIQDFVKLFKSWVHLNLRPDNMLFDRLQPRGNKYNPAEYMNMELNYSILAYIICYQELGKTIITYWVKNIRHYKKLFKFPRYSDVKLAVWYGTVLTYPWPWVWEASSLPIRQKVGGNELWFVSACAVCTTVEYDNSHCHGNTIWLDTATEGRKEIFYLTTHSTHFIYSYMASGHCKVETKQSKKNYCYLIRKRKRKCFI